MKGFAISFLANRVSIIAVLLLLSSYVCAEATSESNDLVDIYQAAISQFMQ